MLAISIVWLSDLQPPTSEQSSMPTAEYEITSRAPSKIPLRDLSRCIKIVQIGDAVDPDSASVELPRSHILVFALAGGHIVGVGAIKRRRPAYARQIAERSGASFDPNTLELGYVAVEPNHRGRGLSELIVLELLAHHPDALFATTSSEPLRNDSIIRSTMLAYEYEKVHRRSRGFVRPGPRGQGSGSDGFSQWTNRKRPCRKDLPHMSRKTGVFSYHSG
jgi:GNAT superfamily N-acetyltransferase